jgi:hypothetical protein
VIGSGVGVTTAEMMKITTIACRRYFFRNSVVMIPSQTIKRMTRGNSNTAPAPSTSQVRVLK